MRTLLQLSVLSLADLLCWGSAAVDLALLPEPELARDVFQAWQRRLSAAAAAHQRPPLGRQQQVLASFAAAFWRPQLLRLAYPGSIPAGLSSLPLIAQRLQHLELSAPALWQLDVVATACRHLRCLSLRGCCQLSDASLAPLPSLAALQALDLAGLAQLTDAAVYAIAQLPQLEALNVSGTAVGDRSCELLSYGNKVRAWQQAAGAGELPPEAAAWPPLPLTHLQLAGTHVGPAGAAELAHLPQLRFLDMRHTGITRGALAPLQRRFALQFVQAAVLSSSNSVAAAVVNQNAVLCRCGLGGSQPGGGGSSPATELESWEAAGVQLLLHFDPAAGLAGVTTDDGHRRQQPLAWQSSGSGSAGPHAAHGSAAGASGAAWQQQQEQQQRYTSSPGGRHTGYRQPRQPPLGRGKATPAGTAGALQQARTKRNWHACSAG